MELWWHTNNNAGFGCKKAGKKAQQLGVRPGIPDLFFARPNAFHAGLFIELKSTQGRVSKAQKQVMQQLSANGYRVEVCRDLDTFIDVINEYFSHGRREATNPNTQP